ncbi:COMM domain-containing protein 7 isoform X2 [Corythoichthys intestinalis]|uniref:COMM domain-containing protein 7 isoform X2 n=1 Tax=Corythoichthys intestinalis TaxID=161448 RepID=UPI0025A603C1|nr:COMM domain-containing protein 7 isoform X2 [Corythoichthys intestinalis]
MMQLHFTKDALPHSVSGDFNNLNKFNEEQFVRLVEILFQFLLEPKAAEKLMQRLSDFAAENRMSAGPLKNLIKSVILVPQGAIKKNLTAVQLKEDLQTLGLHEDKAAHFSEQWEEHRATLCRLAARQMLTVNRLVDMEWKFGAQIGRPEGEFHRKPLHGIVTPPVLQLPA